MTNSNLRYPTGEKVPIEFHIKARIEIGTCSLDMLMFVAEIQDDCILGADFLSRMGIEEILKSAFGILSKNIMEMNISALELNKKEYQKN